VRGRRSLRGTLAVGRRAQGSFSLRRSGGFSVVVIVSGVVWNSIGLIDESIRDQIQGRRLSL